MSSLWTNMIRMRRPLRAGLYVLLQQAADYSADAGLCQNRCE